MNCEFNYFNVNFEDGDVLSGLYNAPSDGLYYRCIGMTKDSKLTLVKLLDIATGEFKPFKYYEEREIIDSISMLEMLDNSSNNSIDVEDKRLYDKIKECNVILTDLNNLTSLMSNTTRFVNIKYNQSITLYRYNQIELQVYLLPEDMTGMYLLDVHDNQIINYYKIIIS